VLRQLRQALAGALTLSPVFVATQARVALADEVGALVQAQAVLVLLGERPGLSSPNSLGAYLTFAPAVGRSDAERNCVSNIRPAGLDAAAAAGRIGWLVREALRRRLSGVQLKDDSTTPILGTEVGGMG
jgi:ethanolamine ammonia-lyase small subunit